MRNLDDVVRRVGGLPVTCGERAVVDAWGRPAGLTRAEVRAAAIDAVRCRTCRPADLLLEIERRPCLPGRAALLGLVRLLGEGCRSGAARHGSPSQRERDIRRDALVATAGRRTLRFGYRRLTGESAACRTEIRAVHETRRRLLRPERVR